ncbi:MAG: restriction endonuclease [Bryobacter sp.]|nr:restriction endonuclease [Bryobacter sp.]
MAIPDFQSFLLPVLRIVEKNGQIEVSKVFQPLALEFSLTPEDLAEKLNSGTQTRYQNRVYWAVVHLRKAGLIESPQRGLLKITSRGRSLLATNGEARITLRTLDQYPEYVEFRSSSATSGSTNSKTADAAEDIVTPQELLERSFAQINETLAQELLDLLLNRPPSFFEQVVVDLLVAMGYGGAAEDASSVVGSSGDGGIDGIIKQDRLGLDNIYVQAKRWGREHKVGRPEVQGFAGSLLQHHAKKGVFLTTAGITNEAKNYVASIEPKIVLIDGKELTKLMIQFNVGVSASQTLVLKKIDTDYFE